MFKRLAKQFALQAAGREAFKKFAHRTLNYAKVTPGWNDVFDDEELRFVGFFMAHGHRSVSQIFQDLWVLFETDDMHGGYFVEFGAADGAFISNTHLLEKKFGWNGILSEPAPVWHEKLALNRSCTISHKCVWTQTGDTLTFRVVDDPGFSTLSTFADSDMHSRTREAAREIQVDTISLLDLLDECGAPKTIDFMSLDTEGSELSILETFDFDRYDVRLICVEHNYTENEAKLDELLGSKGFERRFRNYSFFDGWYRNKRHF